MDPFVQLVQIVTDSRCAYLPTDYESILHDFQYTMSWVISYSYKQFFIMFPWQLIKFVLCLS